MFTFRASRSGRICCVAGHSLYHSTTSWLDALRLQPPRLVKCPGWPLPMAMSNFNATDKSRRHGLPSRSACEAAEFRRTEFHFKKNGNLFNRLRYHWELGYRFQRTLIVCRRGVQAGENEKEMEQESLSETTCPGQNLDGSVQQLDTGTAMHGRCRCRHRLLLEANNMLKLLICANHSKSSPEGAHAGGTAVAQETDRLSMSREVTPSQAHQTPRHERRRI